MQRYDLWRTRFYYLLWFGGAGSVNPFLNLFYIKLGLSGTQIGWLAAISAVVTLTAAPYWTSRHETVKNPRRMLQAFMVLNALSLFLLSQQAIFLGIAAVTIFRALFAAGIMPLSDSLALTVIHTAKAGFGSVRVFGSLGWMIFVLISGWIADQAGIRFSLMTAGVLTFSSALVLFMITPTHFSTDAARAKTRPNLRYVLHKLADHPLMLGVGVMIVVIGMANSGVQQFEPTYLTRLGARESTVGIASMLGSVVELPFMFVADHLLRKRDPYRLILIAMVMYACLRLLVFMVPAVPTILLVQAVTGINFSFYTVSLVRFIGGHTMPHETRMMLAFFNVTLVSVTAMVSAPLAGAFYDTFGPHWLYAIAASGYLIAWVVLQVAVRAESRHLKGSHVPG